MSSLEQLSVVCGYARLRRNLEVLADDFQAAARDYPLIWCQVIHGAPDWTCFMAQNPGNEFDWQEWEVLSSRDCCVRFFGNEISLSSFTSMAKRGMELVWALDDLQKANGFVQPEGMVLQLPAERDHLGWLRLVFQTAQCYSTATLQADPGFWGHSGSVDVAKVRDPLFEELRADLFSSSAEAIRLWLNPSEAVRVGPYVDESPIDLPPPPERDGPQLPDSFWFHGKCYKDFASLEMRLLDCLWGRDGVTIQEAIEKVYGDEAEDKDTAILSLKKRVSAKFVEQNAPLEMKCRDGRFYLCPFKD